MIFDQQQHHESLTTQSDVSMQNKSAEGEPK